MGSLEGKVIAVTGAASGIGLATARLLASRGVKVSISDVREDALQTAVATIQDGASPSAEIFSQVVDVTKRGEVEAWLGATVDKFGKLHGAANVAGIFDKMPGQTVQEHDDERWHKILDVNLNGVFICLRDQLRRLENGGSIVNVSSIAGLMGIPNTAAYCASKHAIIGLSKSAAKEVGDREIRVNCVAPGYVDTPALWAAGIKSDNLAPSVLIKRVGQAGEVASLIAFLLGDESKYVTGAVYNMDGGMMS